MAKTGRKPVTQETIYSAAPILPGVHVGVSPQSQRIHVKAQRKSLLALAALYVLPWVLLGLLYWNYRSAAPLTPNRIPREMLKPGPWGTVECLEFVTEPPDDFISPDLFPAVDAEWLFRSASPDAVASLLDRAAVPPPTKASLLQTLEHVDNVGVKLKPTPEILLSIPPAARALIYEELAKTAENQRQKDPFIFIPEQLNHWLAERKCSASTVALVNKLLYPHDNRVLLADTASLMKLISDENEKIRLLGALLRRSTVMARLRIEPETDVKALESYWGAGGRVNEVQPILTSLKRLNGSMGYAISYFVPAFVRERLYNYPRSGDAAARQRDCHWTALNFFNETPDDRYTIPANVREAYLNDYYITDKAAQLGDIATFLTANGSIIHSCVYIADDVYFTKNGPSQISPWVLMHLDDIKAMFPAHGPLDVRIYRRKKS